MKFSKIFLFIFFFGILLRILALNIRDITFDEAFSYHVAKLPIKELLQSTISDNNPPLYYLILHFIIKFGSSPTILRLGSLVFGLVSIIVLYRFLKKAKGEKIALFASAFFSLSPLAIYLSTEARLHSLAILMLSILIAAFFNLIQKKSLKSKLTFILSATIGLYTHFYILLLFIPFSFILLMQKSKRKQLFKILVTPLLFFSPWILISLKTPHNNCWCPNTVLSLPASVISPAIAGVGVVTQRSFLTLPPAVIILFFTVSTTMLVLFFKGLLQDKRAASVYLIPILILSLPGFFVPVFSPKAFSIYIPVFFWIAAMGLRSYVSKWLTLIIFSLLLATSIIQLAMPFFRGEQVKRAYLTTLRSPNAPIAHTSLASYYSFSYYSRGSRQNIMVLKNPLSEYTTKYILGEKNQIDNNIQKVWLIDTNQWVDQIERDKTLREILNDFKTIYLYRENTFTIYYLERKL